MTWTDFDSLTNPLLLALPELRPVYLERQEFSGEQFGPHVVYGDILTEHFLLPLLQSPAPDDALLKRAFAFIEELAADENPPVREVVRVTVCERLGDDRECLGRAQQYMGPRTRALSDDIEKYFGRG